MQAEINALPVFPEAARLPVNILGLTQIDDGGGNATIVTGRTIPWLQDTEEWKAWDSWQVTYRDVFILDAENRVVGIYNLTPHNLADSTNYATLMNMILEAAELEAEAEITIK
ncbi:MAG: Uncharacterized protein FD129_149 [bacterium]|nr:MAG: Uncharacterized protein FD129_149 [bacterium]